MFIKLTGRTKATVVIRADRIEVIDGVTVDGEDFTAVVIMDRDAHFAVKETPEQIMEMLKPKFVKLNGAGEVKEPLYILPHQIYMMGVGIDVDDDSRTKFTAIHAKGHEGYVPVQETPEQIMEMIENARN